MKTNLNTIRTSIHLDNHLKPNSAAKYVLNGMFFLIIQMLFHQPYVHENQVDDKDSYLIDIFQERRYKVFQAQATDKQFDLL